MRRTAIRSLQWKTAVAPAKSGAGYVVTLDGRPLKTPGGSQLALPPSKPWLAQGVAQEWAAIQSMSQLKPHMVPLTSLAGRAIDLRPEDRPQVANKLLPYLDTDTLVVLSPAKDCNGELRRAQIARFSPVLTDAYNFWRLQDKLQVLDTEKSLFGNYQTAGTKAKVEEWMSGLDAWQFAALERATTAARSLIVGMNTVMHRRSVEDLAQLVTLDVTYQTKQWGEVEDTHDVDHADVRRLLGAAYLASL